jgi:hypothetical protein
VNLSRYGPFVNVVAVASALVATFSMLLLKMFGGVKRWTWLTSGAPPFLVTAGARILAVALMAVTYVTISKSNYGWFAGAASLCGVLGFIAIARFDRLRERHVVQVPMVGADGKPLMDRRKKEVQQNVVVGLEAELRNDAKVALDKAREKRGGLSVRQFMSGFGPQRVNDPEALWDSGLLANIRSTMTITLMGALLLGVMALFLGAFIIEVYNR